MKYPMGNVIITKIRHLCGDNAGQLFKKPQLRSEVHIVELIILMDSHFIMRSQSAITVHNPG